MLIGALTFFCSVVRRVRRLVGGVVVRRGLVWSIAPGAEPVAAAPSTSAPWYWSTPWSVVLTFLAYAFVSAGFVWPTSPPFAAPAQDADRSVDVDLLGRRVRVTVLVRLVAVLRVLRLVDGAVAHEPFDRRPALVLVDRLVRGVGVLGTGGGGAVVALSTSPPFAPQLRMLIGALTLTCCGGLASPAVRLVAVRRLLRLGDRSSTARHVVGGSSAPGDVRVLVLVDRLVGAVVVVGVRLGVRLVALADRAAVRAPAQDADRQVDVRLLRRRVCLGVLIGAVLIGP